MVEMQKCAKESLEQMALPLCRPMSLLVPSSLLTVEIAAGLVFPFYCFRKYAGKT
jgi:hypothetical protein